MADTERTVEKAQALFDPRGYDSILKSFMSLNERMSNVMIDAATRSTDIYADTAHQTFDNFREASQLRDSAAEYGQAYSDLMQRQMDLTIRTAQSLMEVTQSTGSSAAEAMQEHGRDATEKASENAEKATSRAKSTAKSATQNAKSATEAA